MVAPSLLPFLTDPGKAYEVALLFHLFMYE